MYVHKTKHRIYLLKTLRSLFHTCASFINFSDAFFLFFFQNQSEKVANI